MGEGKGLSVLGDVLVGVSGDVLECVLEYV